MIEYWHVLLYLLYAFAQAIYVVRTSSKKGDEIYAVIGLIILAPLATIFLLLALVIRLFIEIGRFIEWCVFVGRHKR